MRSSHYGSAICQARPIMRRRFQTTKQRCTSCCLVTRLYFVIRIYGGFSRNNLCLLLFSNADQIVKRPPEAQRRGRTMNSCWRQNWVVAKVRKHPHPYVGDKLIFQGGSGIQLLQFFRGKILLFQRMFYRKNQGL